MPYSKDPAKYPPELQQLPDALARATKDELRILTADRREANSRRVQLQMYFAALGHKAREMRALAQREADKRLKAAQLSANTRDATRASAVREEAIRLTKDDIKEADAVATIWEDRASAVLAWMVRTIEAEGKHYVVIQRRTLGTFGSALMAELAEASPPMNIGSPSAPQSVAATERLAPDAPVLKTEGCTAPTDTTLEAQLALLRQANRELGN